MIKVNSLSNEPFKVAVTILSQTNRQFVFIAKLTSGPG